MEELTIAGKIITLVLQGDSDESIQKHIQLIDNTLNEEQSLQIVDQIKNIMRGKGLIK